MVRINKDRLDKSLAMVYETLSARGKARWEELPPVVRATLKSLGIEKDEVSIDDFIDALIEKQPDAIELDPIPPCIIEAAKRKDIDALDEILSYFRTYGNYDMLEPIMWEIGYFRLDNYQQRKNSLLSMVKSADVFRCPGEKPKVLSKYCNPKLCIIYQNVDNLAKLLIESVEFDEIEGLHAANIIIKLKNGDVIIFESRLYPLFVERDMSWWRALAEDVSRELQKRYGIFTPAEYVKDVIYDLWLKKYIFGEEEEGGEHDEG